MTHPDGQSPFWFRKVYHLRHQGYMDLPPEELDAKVKEQEDSLAAVQKDRDGCLRFFAFACLPPAPERSHIFTPNALDASRLVAAQLGGFFRVASAGGGFSHFTRLSMHIRRVPGRWKGPFARRWMTYCKACRRNTLKHGSGRSWTSDGGTRECAFLYCFSPIVSWNQRLTSVPFDAPTPNVPNFPPSDFPKKTGSPTLSAPAQRGRREPMRKRRWTRSGAAGLDS